MSTLAPSQFRKIATIAMDRWGLDLQEKKFDMVSGRLSKFLRGSDFEDAGAYLSHLEHTDDEGDWVAFFDVLSTNVTSFFRERGHFDYLEREFYTPLARSNITFPGKRIRFWSAGCSTGPEPYSMGMQALELFPGIRQWDFKILATDLSTSALEDARKAVYPTANSESIPTNMLKHYARRGTGVQNNLFKISRLVTSLVTVRQLNLMDPWPMQGHFNVIFCCNVMIYFDKQTRQRLVRRFYDALAPGGIFGIGSAETLSGLDTEFTSVQASLYVK